MKMWRTRWDATKFMLFGRQLSEPGRFAYAGLCGVSLGQLFQGPEQKRFRETYLEGLVQWLDLDESVMPVMQAFLAGLGFEGTDTFLSILHAEPLLRAGALPITQVHVEESSRRQKKERGRKLRRYLLIGLATVGGGTVIGVTGGLAAPLVAAGAGAVLGAGGAAVLGSATGIAIMASLFGAAGAGLTGYKMNKRVGAIEEFEFLPMSSGKHLHLTIAVTGWLCSGKYSSFQAPWSSLGVCGEQYCLKWESRYLLDLGSILDSLWDGLVSVVAQEALKYTVLSGIVMALTWPASLLAVASVIDNPWGVCLSRSAEVGKHLAQVLRSRQQVRVERIWVLGDWLLGFLYRSSSVQLSVAGLQPINSQDRKIINVDLSSVVSKCMCVLSIKTPPAVNRKGIVKLSPTKDYNYCNYCRRKLLVDIQVESFNPVLLPHKKRENYL
uniref:Transmembrane and coiled-coil domains 4 n=1 Tax=Sinocyclocheilus grahami TaxID=75366 RepID=A0A672MPS6_SINGR